MREKKTRRKNNKGLTLVELVVTVAIIAIFSGIILSIVTTSSNTFRSTSNTAKVQMKTQELLDTIQDLVIDANRSIYYEIGNQKIENDIDGADVNIADMTSKRTFYVCNLSKDETALEYDILRWDPLTKEVRYSWKSVPISESEPGGGTESAFAADGEEPGSVGGNGDDTGVNGAADNGGEPEGKSSLLAENVTSFRADVTKVKGLRIVRFRIVMNERGKEITTLHTVNLRNEIQILPPDVNFPDVPEIDIKVRIEGDDTCFVGDKKTYYAVVVGDYVPDSISWSIDKPELAEIDGNGMLTAKAEGEVTITLTVYDTKGNPHTDTKKVTILTKPEEKIAVEIIEDQNPLVAKAGEDLDLKARITEGILSEVVSWTAVPVSENEDLGEIEITWDNELNAKLNVENPGMVLVTITVKNADGDPATDTAIVIVEEEELPFNLKIDGPLAVEVEKNGALKDLSAYTVYKVIEGQPDEIYNGPVTWHCSEDNSYVEMKNGQIVISADAWTAPNGPGTFEIWVTDEEGRKSNKVTVTIISIRITLPADGSVFKQGDEVPVEVVYFVGNEKQDDTKYQLQLNGQSWSKPYKVTNVGSDIPIIASGSVMIPVEDQITIDVEARKYIIQGSQTMPISVAKIGSTQPFIYNGNPYLLDLNTMANQISRMYWVEDEEKPNEYVEAQISYVRNANETIIFSAVVPGAAVQPEPLTVNIVRVEIETPIPGNVLVEGKSYSCTANLTRGTIGDCRWTSNGNQQNGTLTVISANVSTGITLNVATDVEMKNILASYPFEITDTQKYMVNAKNEEEDDRKNFILHIKEVDRDSDDSLNTIHIPLNDHSQSSTWVRAMISNSGNLENDHTDKGSEFEWWLEIPALGLRIENAGGIATFPEGDNNSFTGNSGLITFDNWTFPEDVEGDSLPGKLYVQCIVQKRTKIRSVSVICKKDGITETVPPTNN